MIGPDTHSASGIDENTTDFATSPNGRGAIGAANSALMLKINFTFSASISRRYRKASPADRTHRPKSPANAPVKISRQNNAPVAFATANVDFGSHSTFTPNGTLTSLRTEATTSTIAATDATSASRRYGRSFSLQNITA